MSYDRVSVGQGDLCERGGCLRRWSHREPRLESKGIHWWV